MSDIYQENITGQISSTASVSGETKDSSPPFKMIFPCNSVADFPTAGKENALYIDKSVKPNIAYRWDAEESAYIMVGGAGGSGGGEGGGGVTSYPLLSDKPTINGVTLVGDLASEDLNLVSGDGADGLSPIIDVIEIEGGYKVTITDVNDTESFNVLDGTDGVSPTIKISEIENGHKVTVTDVEGSRDFEVLNGKDGTDAEVPETLPNPYALTLTGAVSAVYNGSEAVTVEIPIGGGGGGTELDYSTVEQATGRKWIDGKPIYMKVVLGNIAVTTSYQSVSHGILKSDGETADLETLVQCDFFAITDAGRYYAVPYGNDEGKVILKYLVTSAMFMIKNSSSTEFGLQAVMYYTRKSDSVGEVSE